MILYADTPGERLDAFLSRSVEDLSRSAAQKLLEEGCVKRNGKPGKKNDRLEPGDAIDVTIPEPKPLEAVPTKMDLEIAYEDEDVLVINKPKGLVVHPPGMRTTPWSTAFCMPVGTAFPASTGSCGRASSTALTRTPPACWLLPKTTWPTAFWLPS